MFLADKFPQLYENLIPEILDLEVPTEKFANCSQCHIASTDKKSSSLTKCCTYHANLPNYIVGALLSDNTPSWQEGRLRVQQKIKEKIGVTPYGVISPLNFEVLKLERIREGRMDILPFEIREKLTCPYLDNGKCTVWKYRSELCITYFCNSVGGRQGKNFWNLLFQYVRALETKLSLYALKEVAYSGLVTTQQIDPSTYNLQKKNGSLNQNLYKTLWGRHIDEEENLYMACHEVISTLNPEKTESILGWELKWLEDKLRKQLEVFKNSQLPLLAIYDENNVVSKIEDDRYSVTSAKGRTITLGTRDLLALKSFDGTKNLQDIQRSSHQLLPINTNRYTFYLKTGILKPVQAK